MDEPTILLVDDNPANLSVLTNMLESSGYTILVARTGFSALDMAAYAQPDIILLDVMMPGLDGFETCRRLKANQATQAIPVIFMTALNSTENKVKGFQAGAVDYITKPVQHEEVLARVSTHIRLQTQTRQLAELNASKDKLFSIISHDLRTPFNSLLTLSQLLVLGIGTKTEEDTRKIARRIYDSAQTTYDLLQNLLAWAMMQSGRMTLTPEPVNLNTAVQNTVTLWTKIAEDKHVQLITQIDPRLDVLADKQMLDLLMRNLISNSIKFTPSGGTVSVSAEPAYDRGRAGGDEQGTIVGAKIQVIDTGVGIHEEDIKKIFSGLAPNKTAGTQNETGAGLGLNLCQDMLQAQGDQLHIESRLNEGTAVWFFLPCVNDPVPDQTD